MSRSKRSSICKDSMIFHNGIIQAPDGVNLSRCGKDKLQWYLSRNLADLVADDPPTIRLRFEPSGRSGLDDPLLLMGKPNICVVCGCDQNLTRHHIVPYSFIRHMKLEYKMDVIRDIFPLCRPCHNIYEKKSWVKREEFAKQYEIPIGGIESEEMSKYRKAAGAAVALLKYRAKIPAERQEYLFNVVRDFTKKQEITEDDLKGISRHKVKKRSDYVNFSKFIADNIKDYNEFAKDWRVHFVETMQPKHMPDVWTVDRKTKNVWVPNRVKKDHGQI